MKYVLFYDAAPDAAEQAPAHFPAHGARLDAYHTSGDLLMVGTFGDPLTQGSMGIFTSREKAEEFAAGDPFVIHGVVQAWRVWEWNEILTP